MPDSADPLAAEPDSTDGTTDGTTDLLSALDEIRQSLENAAPLPPGATAAAVQAQHDQLLALRDVYAPALLGVVAGALELTETWDGEAQAIRDGVQGDLAAGYGVAGAVEVCAQKLRAAISGALLGEEAADGA
jgi:hypothetical protein